MNDVIEQRRKDSSEGSATKELSPTMQILPSEELKHVAGGQANLNTLAPLF